MAQDTRPTIRIRDAGEHVGAPVRIGGWVYNRRSGGKVVFLILRDGSGLLQCVGSAKDMPAEAWDALGSLPQESSLWVCGTVRRDARAPGGYELALEDLSVIQAAQPDYPLALKEHGPEFLMDNRHLWLRSPRQAAVMRVRAEVVRACRDHLDSEGFLLMDAPVLTPAACEGTTTLFGTDYFGQQAFLTQSGQLYNEAAAMALGRVYCFGPAFRAEKSKTRRHLIEFWMLEPEMAFVEQEENMQVQERLITAIVERVLERQRGELELLERDVEPLLRVKPPFPRITYDSALEILQGKDLALPWGEDLGAPHEVVLAEEFGRPVFVTHYPAACKAFYMQPDPARPEVVLCADLLAPEGYGEIIGGSQRIHDPELMERKVREIGLPTEAYRWYMDLRRYGTVPHSGFGMGIERVVSWLCGLAHVREAIPFPRLLNRIYP
ncbi:MAG: asparagine--tRNA ligase [Bacillota bacterium]|nr:asparagine--tRNA ligase [Bacillota bacterium]